MELKSKRIKKIAVRHSKNKKTSCKLQSKKHSKAIRTTQPLANSTKADSEAILPSRTQLVFLRALFHVKQYRTTIKDICRMKNRLDHLCGAQKRKVF